MSKGNMLLGHARGKVGDIVFSRANGQQIVRARAEVVRNPQTTAQMVQRIVMLTAVNAYSAMSTIVDHSFEGVKPGQESMSLFISEAVKAMRAKLAESLGNYEEAKSFAPIGSQVFACNEYLVSKGKLPKVELTGAAGGGGQFALTTNTYAGVIAQYGLEKGDQLTFVTVEGTNEQDASFHFARVILSPSDGDLSKAFVADGAIVSPNAMNEGSFTTLEFSANSVDFKLTNKTYLMAAAIIVSRKGANDEWKRSTAYLTVAEDYDLYNMQECLDLLASGAVLSRSPRYLNNANSVVTSTSDNNGGGGSGTGGGGNNDGGADPDPGGSDNND